MARNIFVVNCAQVVTSGAHPEGLYSIVNSYPKFYDSNTYNGDTEAALRAAKSEYYARLSANYSGSDTRVMATTTLSQANGQLIMRECVGSFPAIPEPTPEPEPEPEEPVESEGE